jgi:hypothetical protein
MTVACKEKLLMPHPRPITSWLPVAWRSLASLAALLIAMPAQAQIVTNDSLSIIDALVRDAGTAVALEQQQMAMPFSGPFGLPVLLASMGAAILLAWPIRLWLLHRMAALLQSLPFNTGLTIAARAVGAVVITTLLISLSGQLALGAIAWSVMLLPPRRACSRLWRWRSVSPVSGPGWGGPCAPRTTRNCGRSDCLPVLARPWLSIPSRPGRCSV